MSYGPHMIIFLSEDGVRIEAGLSYVDAIQVAEMSISRGFPGIAKVVKPMRTLFRPEYHHLVRAMEDGRAFQKQSDLETLARRQRDQLEQINVALATYYQALHNRKNGDVAANVFVNQVEQILDSAETKGALAAVSDSGRQELGDPTQNAGRSRNDTVHEH